MPKIRERVLTDRGFGAGEGVVDSSSGAKIVELNDKLALLAEEMKLLKEALAKSEGEKAQLKKEVVEAYEVASKLGKEDKGNKK